MTYAELLRDYARHAEAKFLNGGAHDRGRTERRLIHVRPENIHHIGKESDVAPNAYPVVTRVWRLSSCTVEATGQGAEPSTSAVPWSRCGTNLAA